MGLEGLQIGEAAVGQSHKAHVADELQKKAQILKETRKANEELRLNKKPKDGVTPEHP